MKVITTYTKDILSYLEYNQKSVSKYCLRHGYDYLLYKSKINVNNRTHHWSKI